MMKFKYKGIDRFGRPVFVSKEQIHIGSVNILFNYGATSQEVMNRIKGEELVYFGRTFNCEPEGTKIDLTKVELVWD